MALPGVLAALAVVILASTATNASSTPGLFRLNLVTFNDGAASDTFWDTAPVDIPGMTLTAVHCHGSVTYELQLGATGPSHENACYAALGLYDGGSSQWGVYTMLPGNQAVYRISEDFGPWRYCTAAVITYSAPPSMPPDPAPPC